MGRGGGKGQQEGAEEERKGSREERKRGKKKRGTERRCKGRKDGRTRGKEEGRVGRTLHQFPFAAVTNYHKHRCLKQHRSIPLQIWRSET